MPGPGERPAGARRGYVVLHEVEPGLWHLVGDVEHRPGRSARAARVAAVRDAVGGADGDAVGEGEVYAALPRDQWHVVRDG